MCCSRSSTNTQTRSRTRPTAASAPTLRAAREAPPLQSTRRCGCPTPMPSTTSPSRTTPRCAPRCCRRRTRLRKYLEEFLSVHLPGLGWQTKYSRVSFGNERYSEVVRRSDHQGKVLLVQAFVAAVGVPSILGGAVLYLRHRRALDAELRTLFGWVMGFRGQPQ